VREAAGLPAPKPAKPRPPAAPKGLPFEAVARDAAWYARNVPCATACPVGTDAGTYVGLLARGRFEEAYHAARGPNPLASVCARVCAAPCEDACRRGAIDEPVAIRPLKRFLTERHGPESGANLRAEVVGGDRAPGIEGPAHAHYLRELGAGTVTGRRVAVVGGGPAGLACAHDLAALGHRVTIFEASARLGGMMRHGIPEHRLPRGVLDAEIGSILDLGVDVRTNTSFGPGHGLDTLFRDGFEAVFLATGAGRGRDLDVDGGGLDGVVRAIDYLINVHRGYRMELGARVVVVGGGNVALDVARTLRRGTRPSAMPVRDSDAARTLGPSLPSDALRTAVEGGPAEVHVLARQPLGEWPAQKSVHGREEFAEAQAEGVVFHALRGIRRIEGRDGRVVGVELAEVVRLRDETGRYAPLYGDHVAETIPCDAVLLAVGQEADEGLLSSTPGLRRTPDGFVETDHETLATSVPGLFAGGDVAFGPRTLIEAVAEGKRAARSIHARLSGGRVLEMRHRFTEVHPRGVPASPVYDATPRAEPPTRPLARRTGIAEVEGGYDEEAAVREASRCLTCHVQTVYDGSLCIACSRCVEICPLTCLALVPTGTVEVRPRSAVVDVGGEAALMLKDEDRCIRCGLCAERCPTGAMTMERYESAAAGVLS
jgi:NADPH-dependent glutamate synthase beta subunit-like oxidoreductase